MKNLKNFLELKNDFLAIASMQNLEVLNCFNNQISELPSNINAVRNFNLQIISAGFILSSRTSSHKSTAIKADFSHVL